MLRELTDFGTYSDGLKITNTGGNMVPYNKPITVHIPCADGI
jgi:hypothetical protein